MFHGIEEPTDVQIQHPIDFPLHNGHIQRVQSIVLPSARSEPIREAEKIGLVDLI